MFLPMGEADQQKDSVWRQAHADRAHVVIDADAYFEAARAAMMKARHRILLIGWDFDTRIALTRVRRKPGDPPKRLGDFITWLADRTPGLEVRILKWSFGALKTLGRGKTIIDVARWAIHDQIELKLDSAHPAGCSHHQKIVVIDDCFAVCGGIDMTSDRWDTRDHVDGDPRRKRPNGKPYPPWHDVTMLVEGEAAAALGDLARDRWAVAGGSPMEPCPARVGTPWPDHVVAEFENIAIGIARTRAAHGEVEEVREIEALFLEQIARARHFIYAENQYFASGRIADAIASRLAEADPPEFLIVNPETADGWLEQKAMDGARARLVRSIAASDHRRRFNIVTPFTAAGTAIYVHAKLLIVDDRILRVGSANMNNRSLGLDSECDLYIDCDQPGNGEACEAIRSLRLSLLAEHCEASPEALADAIEAKGGMMSAVESLQGDGRRLERLKLPDLTDAEKILADNAVLDPEHPDDLFEPFASPGLFSRTRWINRSG